MNTEIENLKNAVVKVRHTGVTLCDQGTEDTLQMIKAGLPVFFGSDVGQSSNSAAGVMDTNLMEYEVSPILPFRRAPCVSSILNAPTERV